MTRRSVARLLWVALVFCVPVPFFLVETGFEPVAAIAQLLAITLALIAVEGTGGAVVLAAVILGVQVLAGLVLFRVIAGLVTLLAERTAGRYRTPAVLLLAIAILLVAMTQPIFRTPFRTTGIHSTLIEAFE